MEKTPEIVALEKALIDYIRTLSIAEQDVEKAMEAAFEVLDGELDNFMFD